MGYQSAIDYFGAADDNLKLKSSTLGKTSQAAEAVSERGDVVARTLFGEKSTPNAVYEVKGDFSKAVVLGSVNSPSEPDVPVVLTKVSIKTQAGQAPEITYSGETIQMGGVQTSTIAAGTLAVSARHKAQILMSAFTLAGAGCCLNECSLDAQCELSRAEVGGVTLDHDVYKGLLKVSATVVQSGATAPTITPATGWDMTEPVTNDDPDTGYRTHKFGLTKSLVSVDPS